MENVIATGGGSIAVPFVDPKRPGSVYREQKLGAHTTRRKRRGSGASARGLVQALRAGAALLLAALALPALADTSIVAYRFDADSLTYTCPLVTERSVTRLITTSGASSATLTSVNSDSPFLGVAVGDALVLSVVDDTTGIPAGQKIRRVLTVTSNNEVVVDAAVTIPTAGRTFVWLDLAAATDSEAGWFGWPPSGDGEVFIGLDQVSVATIDYKMEARQCVAGWCAPPIVLQTDNLTGATAAESVARLATDKEFVDQIRVCFKVAASDDDVATITAATNNAIDFVELTNITVPAGMELDFVEDPAGAPDTCQVTLAAGAGTATAIAASAQTRINTVASCSGAGPTNTYGVTWDAGTRKFVIARTAGALAFDLPWITGVNAADGAGALLGYTADDTGALTYTADVETYSSGELTATLDPGIYATGAALCTEVADEMASVAVGSTPACSYSSTTDKVTISATGITELQILWNSGTNNATAADTPLGYAADSTGALSYLAPTALGLDAASEVEKITVTVKR